MKLQITAALMMLASILAPAAHATVDGNDRVFLVVQDINGDYDQPDYFVERAPIIGCYGLAQGARLGAWTEEYKATSNIGCGGPTMYDNINALSCAKVVDSVESQDYMSFSEITLDISKCEDKNNPKFITAIRTTAAKNFPQTNKKEVVLKLIK